GSIGIIPMRSRSLGSRKRLRLISLVLPACSRRTNVQTQLPSSDRHASTRSGSTRSTRMRFAPQPRTSPPPGGWHAVRAVAEELPDVRVVEVGQPLVGAVHVEAEQVLDPVVGVGAAAR